MTDGYPCGSRRFFVRLQTSRENATDDVCRLLLYYYIYADEWTAAPCELNAVMGTAIYADAATTLLCRDTALGLSQRHNLRGAVDKLFGIGYLCHHLQLTCCHNI